MKFKKGEFMNCIKKAGAFALMLVFTASSAAVYAQVPQQQQQPQQQQPQQQQPQQQQPQQQQQQQPQQQLQMNQGQKVDVSDKDLKKFASVYPKVVQKNQKAQEKMKTVIEDNGMDLERFNQIQTAKMQNQETDASKDEMKTVDKITGKLDKIQPELQKGIEKAVESGGLSLEKFQKIAMAIQSDQSLQAKFQKMMAEEKK